MNTKRMSITPKAIQDLLDELEASKQSRLRAWNALQRLRLVLSEVGNVAIPTPPQKTFEAEGEILEHALTKSFRIRNETMKSLCYYNEAIRLEPNAANAYTNRGLAYESQGKLDMANVDFAKADVIKKTGQ
jgi:hypothetical protein